MTTSVNTAKVYDEIIEFIAAGTTPQSVMSNFYRDIQLFRFSDTTGNVFILAGDELQILVFRDGTWRFVNET